ncbi:nicotinate-nucleotide adenylyltransferase [Methylotenera versatilis]|uniref:Probable nicotinate-nucleotide adenylyltransferase n=1 Tax=Methylotenera versatilis (strain 301) TaxID=666681 RepID=D7DN30_METV0|nr:nicotinate-nucleotide adenylyltransferase [Methylotenera versatilis]ADI28969.1 nicotinate (nicotinamide) nucleotide adenylyltransferase [Methylotenera versatilis 301]
MQTIGLLGGTFNPIHFGHLRMAQELADSLSLSAVKFIPSANPPHKPPPQVSSEHRSAMVQLAITGNSQFQFDGRELSRAGASYTVETLESLRDEFGDSASLILIMGSDAFTKLNTWHRWQELIQLCHIALVQRPASTNKESLTKELETFLHNHYTEHVEDLHESSAGLITMQAITPLEISSTAIRQALQLKHSARYLMPENVLDYIAAKQLFSAVSA